MVYIEICVGSSCHLKGAPQIVELMQNKMKEDGLEKEIVLSGSFCTGKCNREGVTISVDEKVYTGIRRDSGPAPCRIMLPSPLQVRKSEGRPPKDEDLYP